MQIHEKILKLRSLLDMSREAFSERIDVPTNTLKSIELKGVIPKSDVLLKICNQFPEFTLWLTIGETEYLAGQYAPGLDNLSKTVFQIIDSVDARNLEQTIVNPKYITNAIFLQSVDEGFAIETVDKETTPLLPSEQTFRKFMESGKYQNTFSFGITQSFGTAILLIINSRDGRRLVNQRAVLVKDNVFDLKDIFKSDSNNEIFLSVKNWIKKAGVKKFDIGTVNYKDLRIIESETDELKLSTIYPGADEESIKALLEWRKEF